MTKNRGNKLTFYKIERYLMTQAELSRQVKKFFTQNGVKTRVKSHYSSIYVTILSSCSDTLLDEAKAMETVEAHGDCQNDTRYYTGVSIHYRYELDLSPEQIETARYLDYQYSGPSWDGNSRRHHLHKTLCEKIGTAAAHMVIEKNIIDYYKQPCKLYLVK